jgi:hypothetical protein
MLYFAAENSIQSKKFFALNTMLLHFIECEQCVGLKNECVLV